MLCRYCERSLIHYFYQTVFYSYTYLLTYLITFCLPCSHLLSHSLSPPISFFTSSHPSFLPPFPTHLLLYCHCILSLYLLLFPPYHCSPVYDFWPRRDSLQQRTIPLRLLLPRRLPKHPSLGNIASHHAIK